MAYSRAPAERKRGLREPTRLPMRRMLLLLCHLQRVLEVRQGGRSRPLPALARLRIALLHKPPHNRPHLHKIRVYLQMRIPNMIFSPPSRLRTQGCPQTRLHLSHNTTHIRAYTPEIHTLRHNLPRVIMYHRPLICSLR